MSLDPPRPPPAPLNALRAFEAAARHESFLRAADELAVSPGAIAQQVRKLEDWAGIRLFDRHPQGVSLTARGARLLPELTEGMARLGSVARALRQSAETITVRIAALPAIAQFWLSPRLGALPDRLSGIEISLHALDDRPSLLHGSFDLALYPLAAQEERPEEAGIEITPLGENQLVPVAAPGLAQELAGLEDLTTVPLIHDTVWQGDWPRWLQAHGLEGAKRGGPAYSLYSLVVERCLAGDGVMIGHTALLDGLLNEGRLVQPFPDRLLPGPQICLFTPSKREPVLDQLIAFLVSEP